MMRMLALCVLGLSLLGGCSDETTGTTGTDAGVSPTDTSQAPADTGMADTTPSDPCESLPEGPGCDDGDP